MSEKKLRRYEITYLVQPEATDEERAKVEDRVAGVFSKMGAHVLRREDWGKRKLAYEIRKYNKAYYTYLIFAGTADVPAELERNLRLLNWQRIERDRIRYRLAQRQRAGLVEQRAIHSRQPLERGAVLDHDPRVTLSSSSVSLGVVTMPPG